MNKNNKGFTLVELLAVIVIMGILLLVAIPGVFGVSNNIKANAYRKKVTDIEAAAKLYGQDFVDDIEERGFIQITVKTLIDNNMYRKESDDCVLGSEDKPCVTDPRDYSSMDNDVITILKKEKRFSAYYIFKEEDVDLFEGKKVEDQFGEYEIRLEHNGATYAPQDTVKVKFGQIPDPIIPPKKIFRVHLNSQDGTSSSNSDQEVKFTFRGYYLTNDRSTMYFDADGKGVKYYNHTTDRVLFAAWDTNSFVLPTPTRQGYIFTGWWDKQSGGNLIGKPGMKYTPSRDNISIYGQWAPIVTVVTLKGQGAYSPATDQKINATYDQAMPVIAIPKKQYTITYNYNGSTQANSTSSPEATFAGYFGQANGKGTKYYNANGTSAHIWNVASETAMLYANWSTASTKLPTPEAREGYDFLGWYTAATGGTKVGNAGANYSFTGNKTLYAHWFKKVFTVSITPSYATSNYSSINITHNSNVTIRITPNNGYYLSGASCSNGYTISAKTGPSYTSYQDITIYNNGVENGSTCTFKAVKLTFAEYLRNLPSSGNVLQNDGTADANMRFMGLNPNNYVIFNKEVWRVIGVFNVSSSVNGAKEQRVKIVRSTVLPVSGKWNGAGGNNYPTSWVAGELEKYVYSINNSGGGVLGTYGDMDRFVSVAYWPLGGANTSNMTVRNMYAAEHSTSVYPGNATYYIGKVGMMSASDYGFASSACYNNTNLYFYSSATCRNTNWIWQSNGNHWESLLTHHTTNRNDVFYIYIANSSISGGIGSIGWDPDQNVLNYDYYRPVVYLKSYVTREGGDGTQSNPYTLGY